MRAHDDSGERRFEPRDHLGVDGAIDVRLSSDRVALMASGGWWAPVSDRGRFGAGELLAAWRSTDDTARPTWTGLAAIGMASRTAPLAVWHGAGTGQGRSGLLRAHPLLKHDAIAGPVFGRSVAQASLEYERPLLHTPVGAPTIAGFVDAARAWRRLNGFAASRLYLDAGLGVRLHAPGADGRIRIDVARGLRGGGGVTLSVGWALPGRDEAPCAVENSGAPSASIASLMSGSIARPISFEVSMRIRTTLVAVVVSSLLWSASATAQQRHVVDPTAMRQAIADQAATDQQNREAVLGVLARSEVRELAGRLGLTVTRAETAVSTLNSVELAQMADQARSADAQLAGGADTIVISVTTLLLIIIIVLLVR